MSTHRQENQSSRVKLAFVGCGAITRQEHLPAGLRSPRVRVAALVDSRLENAQALARMYGLTTTVAGDVSEVLEDAQGFVLATPNDTHYPIAKCILEHGKPLLIEKPITTSYEHALELCELAERRGTFIAVGYRYRFFPSARLLKRLLDEGYFGRVLSFHCEMGSRGGWAPISGYNLERSRSGGGVLVINGTHFLDLAFYWFGEPRSFHYQDDNYGNVEANCKGAWNYDGALGAFEGSFFFSKSIALSNRFQIETERGRVEWSPARAEAISVTNPHHPDLTAQLSATRRAGGEVDSFRDQLEEFCGNVVRRGTISSDGRSGAKSIQLIEEMYRSATRLPESWLPYQARVLSLNHPRLSATRAMSTHKPRVAVLGASGFVGTALVERWYFDESWRDRFEFTAFIRGFGNTARLARLPIRIEALDLTNYRAVESALANYDYVVNCTRGDSALMSRGLKHAIRAMKQAHTRKFVHLGSVAIYGEDPPAESAREEAPPSRVRTEYGDIKAAQDELVFALHRQGVPSIILCPSNIGGPYSSLVLDAVAKLAAGEIVLVEDGLHPTNIVHVDNLVQAILVALTAETGWGERYFVNEEQPVSWKQFFEDLAAMLHIGADFERVPRQQVIERMKRRENRRSAGAKAQVGMLFSSEFREAVSVLPAFRSLNDGAKRLFQRMSPRMQERVRRRLSRPIAVAEASESRALDHKLITAQIRRVYHSPQKITDQLHYRPLLDYREGMETTRKWLEFANAIPRAR